MHKNLWDSPQREYAIIIVTAGAFLFDVFFPSITFVLLIAALIGSLPTLIGALRASVQRKITIDTFNIFALAVSFVSGNVRSAAFIVLMLASASWLDWRTATRAHKAMRELMKLKPDRAIREKKEGTEEIPAAEIQVHDILVVRDGARVPADGVIVFGEAQMNEAAVSGESALIKKVVGDAVISGSMNEAGLIKIRATRVGADSTIERIGALITQAAAHKSRSEKIADRFASWFLPAVVLLGAGTYYVTRNISMTAAIFLVACADDMAVAIPLAMEASIGRAAKYGVVIKGGEWLTALGKIDTIVIDKTGTLTYGNLAVQSVCIAPGVTEKEFWTTIAVAEKFSEHPAGRALMHAAHARVGLVPDPDAFEVIKGMGVIATHRGIKIIAGSPAIEEKFGLHMPETQCANLAAQLHAQGGTACEFFANKKSLGYVTLSDVPRPEARASIAAMHRAGVKRIIMFTGDNEQTAERIATALGIAEVRAHMTPENKLYELEQLMRTQQVAMIGDGVNDAPALSRAHVGIAMGAGGTAVAVEAADVVVLTDNLARVPEMILLGKRTTSVIYSDMFIWAVSNIFGFALVLTGIAGPMFAAFYNFATDFFPLLNSTRLFRRRS